MRSALNTEKIERLYEAYGRAIADYCARRVEQERVDGEVADVFAVAWRNEYSLALARAQGHIRIRGNPKRCAKTEG